ncbi:expressed unknown protein [Seminavis robusta]|uniref:Uncharacterized protein n=1 Tax=Seminavis robusta TaxID=568900 RepID=A0A9N8D9W7_9STRA|nr:expressed unknown protein [Seminavis robusta]|eukprot:Sro53_g031290.1 n/a (88) ;mRNA; r:20108-20371
MTKSNNPSFPSSCRISALQGSQELTETPRSAPGDQLERSRGRNFGGGTVSSAKLHNIIEDVLALIQEDEHEFEDWGLGITRTNQGKQ